MMQSRKGCQSLDEDTMHGNVCHLIELEYRISRRGLKQTREERSHGVWWILSLAECQMFDNRKEWEMQHSSRHIGTEWGSSKDRCWQCLPLALWSMVWRRGMRGATYMLPTLWWICCLHRTKWDWLHNIKWNCESKWKVDFEEIKSLEGTAIFEKIRGLYEIGEVWKD